MASEDTSTSVKPNFRVPDPSAHRYAFVRDFCNHNGIKWCVVVLLGDKAGIFDQKRRIATTFEAPQSVLNDIEVLSEDEQLVSSDFSTWPIIGSLVNDASGQSLLNLRQTIGHVVVPIDVGEIVGTQLAHALSEEIVGSRLERIVSAITSAQHLIQPNFSNNAGDLKKVCQSIASYTGSSTVYICHHVDRVVRIRASNDQSTSDQLSQKIPRKLIKELYEYQHPIRTGVIADLNAALMLVPILVPAFDPDNLNRKVVNQFLICIRGMEQSRPDLFTDTDRRVATIFCRELATGVSEARQRDAAEIVNRLFNENRDGSAMALDLFDRERLMTHITMLVDNVEGIELGEEGDPHVRSEIEGHLFSHRAPTYFRSNDHNFLTFYLSLEDGIWRIARLKLGSRRWISDYKVRIIESYLSRYRIYDAAQKLYMEQIDLAAQIRHDIKAPLSAAKEAIVLIERRARIYAQQPTAFQRLMRNETMARAMTNALLFIWQAISFSESARTLVKALEPGDLKWADFYLSSIFDETEMIFEGAAISRRVRVRFSYEPVFRELLMSGERDLLAIVIHNLVDNAIKFALAGRTVYVNATLTDEERLRVEVIDDGVAIDETERERIFQPWQRSARASVRNRRPGTGLGLAICRDILRAHDPSFVLDFEQEFVDVHRNVSRKSFFFEITIKGRMRSGQQGSD